MQRTRTAGRVRPRTGTPGLKLPVLAFFFLAVAMAAVRVSSADGNAFVYLRSVCSLIALGVVLSGRLSLLRSALLAFAMEATGSIVAFVSVDVPFINAHHAQIAALAVELHDRLQDAAGRSPHT